MIRLKTKLSNKPFECFHSTDAIIPSANLCNTRVMYSNKLTATNMICVLIMPQYGTGVITQESK